MILKNECDRCSANVENLVKIFLEEYRNSPSYDRNAAKLFYHLPSKQDDSPLWILLHNDGHLSSQSRVNILEMLIKNGVDVNELNNEQTSPLQFLCQGRANLTNEACTRMKNVLILAGADVERRDKQGNSTPHLAVRSSAKNGVRSS